MPKDDYILPPTPARDLEAVADAMLEDREPPAGPLARLIAEVKEAERARLTTLAEWRDLDPRSQGYVLYMEAEHTGSELKGQKCPYNTFSAAYQQFKAGQLAAVLQAQDSEE